MYASRLVLRAIQWQTKCFSTGGTFKLIILIKKNHSGNTSMGKKVNVPVCLRTFNPDLPSQ